MRAVMFAEHGGPGSAPGRRRLARARRWPGMAVVDVQACGLNHLDIFVRRGMPGVTVELPHISGGDIAGVVREVGAGGRRRQPVMRPGRSRRAAGQRALGALGEDTQGGLCERKPSPPSSLIPLPDSIDFAEAAALPIAYGTAHRMLLFARTRAGRRDGRRPGRQRRRRYGVRAAGETGRRRSVRCRQLASQAARSVSSAPTT